MIMVGQMESNGKIVVVIPAFNEEKTIAKVVVGAKKSADAVIVCDDGSTDMTAEIAGSLGIQLIRHEENSGKGRALATLIRRGRKTQSGGNRYDRRRRPARPCRDKEGGRASLERGS